jgi:outer membrane protein OmpA-like peptidoglycan-associated protein
MRSRTLLAIAISGALAAPLTGCATAEMKAACSPLASWGAPAFRCGGSAVPEVAVTPPPPPVAAEPEPVKPPEPEAPPPPTAQTRGAMIELSETVQFESESAVLVERSKQLLDDVARELNDHPEIRKVQIEGHADERASKRHNMKLSQDRVASVKSYLVGKGVDGKRLATKAFGETKPIASNKTDEGRAQNRRVEFRIVQRKK